MSTTILVLHKDSTKFVMSPVQQGQEREFIDAAYEQIKKDMHDPEISEKRISVFTLDGTVKMLNAQEYEFIKFPPSERPVQITTFGAENQ